MGPGFLEAVYQKCLVKEFNTKTQIRMFYQSAVIFVNFAPFVVKNQQKR